MTVILHTEKYIYSRPHYLEVFQEFHEILQLRVLITGELASDGLVLLLQLCIGVIGLPKKLQMVIQNAHQCSHEHLKANAGRSTYLAVGSVLFQMNMNAFGDLEQPTPLGL